MQGLLKKIRTTSDAAKQDSLGTTFLKIFQRYIFNKGKRDIVQIPNAVAAQNWSGKLLLLVQMFGYTQVFYYAFYVVYKSLITLLKHCKTEVASKHQISALILFGLHLFRGNRFLTIL